MIASFTNVVPVAPFAVPTQASDLERCVIGRPGSGPGWAVHLVLTHHNGTQFWIRDGAIYGYSSPGSFFTLQDPALVPMFAGTTTLTSNDVVQLAEQTLRRLVKNGDPLRDGPPRVQYASELEGKRIPFFRVSWPHKRLGATTAAQVEIDGRSGKIVCLDLWAEEFFDRALQEEIKRKVHAPELPKPTRRSEHANSPKPTADYVSQAITNWLSFCGKLELQPGSQRTLAGVDWDETFLWSRWGIYSNGVCIAPFCRIKFKNGAFFDSIDGTVFSHHGSDAAFAEGGTTTGSLLRGGFEGQPTKHLDELLRSLQARISTRLGLPGAFFEQTSPKRISPTEFSAGRSLTRANVCWRRLPPQPNADEEMENMRGHFTAEFDLLTGETKSLLFHCYFPQLNEQIWQALRAH